MLNKKIEVGEFNHSLIYKGIVESHALSMKEINYVFPLYLYSEKKDQQSLLDEVVRTPNLNMEIVNQMAKKLGIGFVAEKQDFNDSFVISTQEKSHNTNPTECDASLRQHDKKITFAPIDILDYIYAVLHSPSYREKYKEFLKIDFPRVPYPKNKKTFFDLVTLGRELRQLHLLESATVENYITSYPIGGDNVVGKPRFVISTQEKSHNDNSSECDSSLRQNDNIGRVYINETQYFANVPEVAWSFYIGGYQPAQKWLKDRKERELNFEDILHYQKMIVALTETDRLMKKIDGLLEVE